MNAEGAVTKTEYDKTGNKTADINALGNRTIYYYDSANRLITTEYPDGTTTKTFYDSEGNRTASIDQEGRSTAFEYNSNKQLVKTIYADNSTRQFGYDEAGRQATVTDALGNVTTKVYDNLGRIIANIDPELNSTTFEYDANGNQISQTDPNGHTTTFAYDANNRLTTTTLPGGQTTTIGYDELGRKAAEEDAAGYMTRFEYDVQGNLNRVTDAEGGITRYEYDANNNRTKIIDARTNSTTFDFDNLNRLITKTMPNGGIERYTYDLAGRQKTKTDAKGNTIQYSYDENGRLTTRSYPDNSVVRFAYTGIGKRSSVTDQRGVTTYEYDGMNRLSKLAYPDSQAISYTYDLSGRMHTLSSTLTGTTTYSYSGCCGRLASVTDAAGNTTSYGYDAAGNRIGLGYPNGTSVTYSYDTNNRLTNLTHKNSLAQVIASYAYTLGAIGNRTRIDEAGGSARRYSYDRLYRLTREEVIDPTNAQTYQNDYGYDAISNRQNKTYAAYNQPAVSNDYTYNNADQLLTENGVTYTYDLNGNLATKMDSNGTTTYIYNYDDRLVDVQSSNGTTTYEYDADNNRVQATNAAGTTKYLIDTNRNLAQVLAEYSASGTVIVSYVYADDLISMTRSGATSYYHFDGLGSTRLLSNDSGAITDKYDYDAFGNLIAQTGTTVNNFLFTGQQFDANVGFYYLRARYYQTDIGRFTTLDPYEGDPYAPVSLHKYVYAGNDPINRIDPSGEMFIIDAIITVSIITTLNGIAVAKADENVSLKAYKKALDYINNSSYAGLCNVFVNTVYKNIGHPFTGIQLAAGFHNYPELTVTDKPVQGDVTQFLQSQGAPFNHVAIYAGNHKIITTTRASNPNTHGAIKLIPIDLFGSGEPYRYLHFTK